MSNPTSTASRGRIPLLIVEGKWCIAGMMLFALTLPLTTCQSRGKVQEHHVQIGSGADASVLCFVWPLFILPFRTLSTKVRLAWPLVIVEIVLGVVAWLYLAVGVLLWMLISLGEIAPGSGYELVSSALIGYVVLSLLDLGAVIYLRRVNRPNALHAE